MGNLFVLSMLIDPSWLLCSCFSSGERSLREGRRGHRDGSHHLGGEDERLQDGPVGTQQGGTSRLLQLGKFLSASAAWIHFDRERKEPRLEHRTHSSWYPWKRVSLRLLAHLLIAVFVCISAVLLKYLAHLRVSSASSLCFCLSYC